MSSDLLISGLTVRYKKILAVDDVNLSAPAGSVTWIVGPNGAGKSSTMLAISGAVAVRGRVEIGGEDISAHSATSRVRLGIASVPEGRQIFPRLTVHENLKVMSVVLRAGPQGIERALSRFPILRERAETLAGVLSGGEQQMLAVSRSLIGEPRVLLLDEMTAGLAPVIVKSLMSDIRGLADAGLAVLVAEPTIGPNASYVDRGYVMLRGKIVGEAGSGEALDDLYQERLGVRRG